MHPSTRPVLFARIFVEAVITRPLLRTLLEQRRAVGPAAAPLPAETDPETPLRRAA